MIFQTLWKQVNMKIVMEENERIPHNIIYELQKKKKQRLFTLRLSEIEILCTSN